MRKTADQEKTDDDRMGLAPVFAAALAAACCLAVPLLVGLLAGGATAAASSGGLDLLSLFIIGFALGGVIVVALHVWRASRRHADESAQGKKSESSEAAPRR
ncbi:MAG: hypothetical protein ACT4P3_22305 [Betaproteobacteria bacterium]